MNDDLVKVKIDIPVDFIQWWYSRSIRDRRLPRKTKKREKKMMMKFLQETIIRTAERILEEPESSV